MKKNRQIKKEKKYVRSKIFQNKIGRIKRKVKKRKKDKHLNKLFA